MGKYNKEFTVPYYDCNKYGYIKAVALLEYLVETSSLQSDSMGLGFKELMEKNYGWILSKWKVELLHLPKAMDKIEVQTWTSGFDKFYAYRDFNIFNDDGKLLVKASTLWIFMDTEKKRPVRIPVELYSGYTSVDEKNFSSFLKLNEDSKMNSSMDFRVRKTDIDYNEHVNNAKYLNWFLEPIPLEIDENYFLNEIDIHYKKEIKYNNIIESKISHGKETENKIEFFHEIYNKDSDILTTLARTVWRKK